MTAPSNHTDHRDGVSPAPDGRDGEGAPLADMGGAPDRSSDVASVTAVSLKHGRRSGNAAAVRMRVRNPSKVKA